MQKALTLSLVIPVYNEEHHLKQCLDAVMAQALQPDEVIVVDNNSTDSTVAVALQYNNVRVVRESNQGVLYASRAGYDAATMDIICRIDADTIMPPEWTTQIKHFFEQNTDAAAVTGNCYFYDFPFRRGFRLIHHAVYYRAQKLIAGTEVLWGSNMAMKTSAWQAVRNDCISRPDIHEDIDLTLHLKAHNMIIRRWPKLTVGVSLLRGNLGPRKAISYLWPWPNTYWVNRYHVKAILICFVLMVVWLVTLPLSSLLWLFKKLSHSPRPHN
ncbi:MAG TPA: glycosyltransferase family 2 protein [Candidatus Limnocylindrales bacterium]|nr:glycosyltransferase family 2 protein [Candidatus Limnocylindrales bacterium]